MDIQQTAETLELELTYSVARWLDEALGDSVGDVEFTSLVDGVVADLVARFAVADLVARFAAVADVA